MIAYWRIKLFNFQDIDSDEFDFDDPIVNYTLNDYTEVLNSYIEHVSHFPDVKAIYQMGSI